MLHQHEQTMDIPMLDEQPYQIVIVHESGVAFDYVSSKFSLEDVMEQFNKLCDEYSSQRIAGAVFDKTGKRITLVILGSCAGMN